MTAEQTSTYLQALLASVTVGVILPALLLMFLLLTVFAVLWRAQQRDDFDVADLLRETTGEIHPDGSTKWRVSTWRFLALMAFAIHAAYLYATLFQKPDAELFLWFGLIWGGTPATVIIANKWNGALPFARGNQ